MSSRHFRLFTDSILGRFSQCLPRGWKWRRSPLGPLQTLITISTMVVLGRKGYTAALAEVFERSHPQFALGRGTPTPSALTQARKRLLSAQLRAVFARLYTAATHLKSRAQLRYRDFQRIVAVDGTTVPLASSAELKKKYGCPNGEHLAPQAQVSLLWNVGGNVPIDWQIGPARQSEQEQFRAMFYNLAPGDLLLGDRLYPSKEVIAACMQGSIAFIFRVKSTGTHTLGAVRDFVVSNDDDRLVYLPDLPDHPVRLIRNRGKNQEERIFVTSLLATDGHTADAIVDLYQRRWGVETAYREGKTWHGLAALPGRSQLHVEQEMASLMIFWLMEGELEGQAREVYAEEIAQQPDVDPQWTPAEGIAESPVRFNRKLAAHTVPIILEAACVDPEHGVRKWRSCLDYLWRNRSRRRPGRSYRRMSQRPHIIRMRDAASAPLCANQKAKIQKTGSYQPPKIVKRSRKRQGKAIT